MKTLHIAGMVMMAVSYASNADELFVETQIDRNLDTNTDYVECETVCRPMRGQAELKVGYTYKVGNHFEISGYLFHRSNPYTPTDYGQNGVGLSARYAWEVK